MERTYQMHVVGFLREELGIGGLRHAESLTQIEPDSGRGRSRCDVQSRRTGCFGEPDDLVRQTMRDPVSPRFGRDEQRGELRHLCCECESKNRESGEIAPDERSEQGPSRIE